LLREIGLSEGEIKVYSALLDIGRAPLNRIHEKTGIERRNIYDILNKLIERGLVTYVLENKRRFFQLSHPTKIVGYIEEKRLGLGKTKEALEKELPQIIEKFSAAKTEIGAEIFRGPEGIKAVWEDMLNHKGIYWLGSGRYVPKKFPSFFAQWNKKRIVKKIRIYNLLRQEMRREIGKPWQFESTRFLPKEFSGNPIVIAIWGNKLGNFLYGESLFAFVIESKELADSYRLYHKYLWEKVAKP
jgi:sugar-specific transcriptional regulator TrmB